MSRLISELVDLPERVRQGDFVLNLSKGVTEPLKTLERYVVTPQLVECFNDSLKLIKTAVDGIANTLLADTLKSKCDVKGDNLSLSFPTASSLETVSEFINGLQLENVRPIPNSDAMENLKFSECLSPEIAAEVFTTRFDDPVGVRQAVEERRRVVVQRCGDDYGIGNR